jgi:uncharacterized protein YecE (DUF72 family)
MKTQLYIGTSGWHYKHWLGLFYPPKISGYNELRFHAEHFNTVENNSSFYRVAKESTYKTWFRMTPAHYKFSMKLNKLITHITGGRAFHRDPVVAPAGLGCSVAARFPCDVDAPYLYHELDGGHVSGSMVA